MDMKIEDKENYSLVSVTRKRFDAVFAPDFREQMQTLANAKPSAVIVDLSTVEFIDSSGLGAIVAAFKLFQPTGDFLLCGASHNVLQLFRLTRMDKVFTLYSDVSSARQTLLS